MTHGPLMNLWMFSVKMSDRECVFVLRYSVIQYMYLYISMLSGQVTEKTPGNHDTVSRNKACRILAVGQALNLPRKEGTLDLFIRHHNSRCNCCRSGFFTLLPAGHTSTNAEWKKQPSSTIVCRICRPPLIFNQAAHRRYHSARFLVTNCVIWIVY